MSSKKGAPKTGKTAPGKKANNGAKASSKKPELKKDEKPELKKEKQPAAPPPAPAPEQKKAPDPEPEETKGKKTKGKKGKAKKSDGSGDNSMLIFAFMNKANNVIVLSAAGKKYCDIAVDSPANANEIFDNGKLVADVNKEYPETVGANFEWVIDPPSNPAVMEACRIMEDGKIEFWFKASEEQFMVQQPAGEFMITPGQLIKKGDFFRFHSDSPAFKKCGTRMFRATLDAQKDLKSEKDDFIINAVERFDRLDTRETKEKPKAPPIAYDFKPTGERKLRPVESPMSFSEKALREIIGDWLALKGEAAEVAADYKARIKTKEDAIKAAAEGKAFDNVECIEEVDWDGAKRRFRHPITGAIVCVEDIPESEIQLKADLKAPGDTATEATPETPAAGPEQAPGDAATPATPETPAAGPEQATGDAATPAIPETPEKPVDFPDFDHGEEQHKPGTDKTETPAGSETTDEAPKSGEGPEDKAADPWDPITGYTPESPDDETGNG